MENPKGNELTYIQWRVLWLCSYLLFTFFPILSTVDSQNLLEVHLQWLCTYVWVFLHGHNSVLLFGSAGQKDTWKSQVPPPSFMEKITVWRWKYYRPFGQSARKSHKTPPNSFSLTVIGWSANIFFLSHPALSPSHPSPSLIEGVPFPTAFDCPGICMYKEPSLTAVHATLICEEGQKFFINFRLFFLLLFLSFRIYSLL